MPAASRKKGLADFSGPEHSICYKAGMIRLFLALILLLSACAQAPVCSGRLGAVKTEIAERERAMERGVRVIPAQDGKTLLRLCGSPELLCTDHVQQPRAARRVPVDIGAEQLALQRLRAEEAELRAQGQACF